MTAANVTSSLLALLARAAGVPARLVAELPNAARAATLGAADEIGRVERVEAAGERYLVCRRVRPNAAPADVERVPPARLRRKIPVPKLAT